MHTLAVLAPWILLALALSLALGLLIGPIMADEGDNTPLTRTPACPSLLSDSLLMATTALSANMSELSRETLKQLRSVLDETWSSLPPEEQARTSKTQIGARILELAAAGERDPVRLREKAIAEIDSCASP